MLKLDEESVETSRFSCNCIRNFREMALPWALTRDQNLVKQASEVRSLHRSVDESKSFLPQYII